MSKICQIKSIREKVIENVEKEMFTNEEYEDLSGLFKTLGDFNRVRIIHSLSKAELCVCELSLLLDMSQSAISHQLSILRAKNIVKFRKEDKKAYYSLINQEIIELIKMVRKDES